MSSAVGMRCRSRYPSVSETDEDSGESSGAGGEVLVCDLACAAGEVHDDWHDEFGFDGMQEARFGFDLVALADDFEDHA